MGICHKMIMTKWKGDSTMEIDIKNMTNSEILSHYLTVMSALMDVTDEMNDAEIDVRTTLAQIRGATDLCMSMLGVKINYERNSDIN